jgi:hypothetical protein
MSKRALVLVVCIVGACRIADPNPGEVPSGGSAGISPSGASGSGNGGMASGAGRGGDGSAHGGAPVEAAGAAGKSEEPDEGGAAGASTSPTEGGAGGEAGESAGGDGCTPACGAGQICLSGECEDQDCAPGASFCSGTSLQTCDASGLSSVEEMDCDQGKYCDPTSKSCKAGYPSCSNIYLGSGRFGANPRPASLANDAIVLLDYEVTVNTVIFGEVHVKNLGTNDSPSTHIELYLSQSPGFATNHSQLIFEENAVVPGAAIGGDGGEYATPWSYTFPAVGHYVLLARVENNSPPTGAACTMQGYDLSSPATDALTAIHYLNVVE